jgi:putative SOS response-associated peptidase YedK
MPVIMSNEKAWDVWLDPSFQEIDELCSLLFPHPAGEMVARPVSTYVNNPRNQGTALYRTNRRSNRMKLWV